MNSDIILRKHQAAAARFAIESIKDHSFAALFMEMGTGKTFTSLSVIEKLKIKKAIIICPKAIIATWTEQIEYFFGDHTICCYTWPGNQKARTKKQKAIFNNFCKNSAMFFLINIESFHTDPKKFYVKPLYKYLHKIKEHTFCVLDESSKIKNHKANRTKNINSIEFDYKIIMTGTEITNSVMDIYTQFEFLKKGFWGFRSFYGFRNRYAIMKDLPLSNGRCVKIIVGNKNIEEIQRKIAPYTFRITKEECLDLPEKIIQVIKLKMNKEQQRVYNELKNDLFVMYKEHLLTSNTKLSAYIRLCQISCGFFPETGELLGSSNIKIDYIKEETEDYKEKYIIWSPFTAPVNYLEKSFKSIARYDGKIKQLDEFKKDKKYLAINIKTGAYGLNLQFCSNVYYLQRSLSLEENQQSEDRTHRIGQNKHVLYKDLVFEGTVDEKIYKSYKNKEDMLKLFRTIESEEFLNVI